MRQTHKSAPFSLSDPCFHSGHLSLVTSPSAKPQVLLDFGHGIIEPLVGFAGEQLALGTALIVFFPHAGADGALIAPGKSGTIRMATFAIDVLCIDGRIVPFGPLGSNAEFLVLISAFCGQIGLTGSAIQTTARYHLRHSISFSFRNLSSSSRLRRE